MWKLEPDIVLMNPVCVCGSHPWRSTNMKAALHGHTFINGARKQLTYTGQEEARRPDVCPDPFAFYFSPMLETPRGDGGRGKKIHLLTDSAILDFCYSPSVTWSAPAFTRGGVSRMKTGPSTAVLVGLILCF